MNYDLWNSTGRMSIGETAEILVNDRKMFPKHEEMEMNFEIHDGFAVGAHEGREYLMLYPMMEDVKNNSAWLERIENYVGEAVVGETGLALSDIALTFGKIVSSRQLPLILDTYDSVVRLDANIPLDKALDVLNNEARKNIRTFYHRETPEVKELPVKDNGMIEKGYLILRPDKPAQYIAQPKTPAEIVALENEALENGTFDSLAHMVELNQMRKLKERVSVVKFTPVKNRLYSVTCKIDGVQMPVKQLSNRESLRVHQNITRNMDPMLTFGYPMLLRRFAGEISQLEQQRQQQGQMPPGQEYRPANYQDFRDFIRQKFPDGLTLQLSGLNFYQLMDLSNLSTDLSGFQASSMHKHLDMPCWDGTIAGESLHPGDVDSPVLHTTVFIHPEQYGFLLPKVIFNPDIDGTELLDMAADMQLKKFDGDCSRMQFQIPRCLEFRNTMQIENTPYRQALKLRYDHRLDDIKSLAECIVLTKIINGTDMQDIRPTWLNQGILDTLNHHMVGKGEPGETSYGKALRTEAYLQMRGRGYCPSGQYNLSFRCSDTKIPAKDNAVRMTDVLNRNFPFVSAMCEGNKVSVSVNTLMPQQQAAVERFIISDETMSSTIRVEPFVDLRDTNRLMYMMSNGQSVDAYVKRPGSGKQNHYVMDNQDGILYMRKMKEGESLSSPAVIATDDKLTADKVQVHDCYKMDENYLRVRDSSLYRKQRAEGLAPEWMVRCKVDGIQELGRPVSMALNHIINCATASGTKAPDSRTWDLLKHYAAFTSYNDLLQAESRIQSRGLGR